MESIAATNVSRDSTQRMAENGSSCSNDDGSEYLEPATPIQPLGCSIPAQFSSTMAFTLKLSRDIDHGILSFMIQNYGCGDSS